MPRHAKNNTNGSVFTYAERQMAKDRNGTSRQRLGRDSMKDYNACSLCLETARDPKACLEGHVFCQECIVTNMLSQKKDIKRQTVLLERMRAESEQEMALARVSARERVLKEFESSQTALASKGSTNTTSGLKGEAAMGHNVVAGSKRKFEFDEDELERRTREATEEALRRTTQEMAEARKAKLPNFWLPSLTPTATPDAVLDVKLQTMCTAGKPAHPLSETCTDTLARPDKACSHCGEKVESKRGFIELQREGTGFAGGGQTETRKYNLPFQG
ncbi:hypothetical protein OIO90_006490 [Microbotryomycetes sp. JL221]|nr:hypothetical protein OIO90_006490 [Microbotryomycetes sp. JL221]